jgi:hypothetical protein
MILPATASSTGGLCMPCRDGRRTAKSATSARPSPPRHDPLHIRVGWSILARNRAFAKAMRRIRPEVEEKTRTIESVTLQHPIHKAILVGITDSEDDLFFAEVANDDGFFQVLAGFDSAIALDGKSDDALVAKVLAKISRAVLSCPFSNPDHNAMEEIVTKWTATQ